MANATTRANRAVIASRLREARKLAGLSQQQAAKLIGVHRPAVSEIEAGRRGVAADELRELSELYEVSISWLLGDGQPRADADGRVELAARELAKLSSEDLDRVVRLLGALRDTGEDV